jgi:hypothetical protein
MNEILDQNPNENTLKSNLFSKLAFGCAMLIFIMPIFYGIFLMPKKIAANSNYHNDMTAIGLILALVLLSGAIFSIISIVRKEKSKYFKIIAIIINFGIIALMILANLIALYKFTK